MLNIAEKVQECDANEAKQHYKSPAQNIFTG